MFLQRLERRASDAPSHVEIFVSCAIEHLDQREGTLGQRDGRGLARLACFCPGIVRCRFQLCKRRPNLRCRNDAARILLGSKRFTDKSENFIRMLREHLDVACTFGFEGHEHDANSSWRLRARQKILQYATAQISRFVGHFVGCVIIPSQRITTLWQMPLKLRLAEEATRRSDPVTRIRVGTTP